MSNHETYIKRCIEIAKNGLGTTRPNPMVGSLIVYNDKIIGEGFTSTYGGNHAEVNAINSVKDKSLLKDATIYVTLEPCSHYGKTPPCSDLIIKHQIPNVVIGCIDDNIQVAGKGIEKLKKADCNLIVGVLENECKDHHKRFFTFHNKKRPYIILKWAETSDGFIAPETKNEQKPVWITNEYSRQLVHKWRTEEQAILVGTHTVLQDNPSLTVRDWTGQNPIRIVLDKDEKLPKDMNVFNKQAETIVIGSKIHNQKPKTQNLNLEVINWDLKTSIAKQICDCLYKHSINSIIIEGGAKTLQTFIDENLWDEARVFTGTTQFKNGVKAPTFSGKLISEEKIVTDILKIYKND
ncbi:bifunctional diaminohydroxyphosphoribosylaminopyrimidine deaminase/5-amino-6-(5-phosphoribosylamino)uracil reductase RibD [Mariniflexile litorale]|uniref:Riboflavin biosynthesis protein RibD n=1 Tax=Mariniflexile litorale TaxID=3045158 RepID=A0AAU7EH13_9FLAO|nr:bifunctional diaminohydroxyphosphoribosylaminopyrimidine deaminase/5-amino-6-(5-phosphoribosylamino)uracil reductase RibD [Mariniflexile sp. KMM 9835]MDQ8211672.1 bifunctional diaminohydroxyphosphoribosylaminopyrimidine deaminase/5-amino-6-(5-phosphoribosylamino)uracil reductase RibD [Mariniflexile sp. KMM 9835]